MSEKSIEQHIDKMILWEKLDQLDTQNRQILILYYWWGYTDAEIGKKLSLSQQVVHYRRKKANKLIKDQIIQSYR